MPISIDTNIFFAFLIPPVSETDTAHHSRAIELLQAVHEERVAGIVSEVVLHESYYVLVMRRKVLTVAEFGLIFQDILTWPGWAIPDSEKGIYLHALDILEENLKLEFSDAVIAARAEAHGAELATFDRRLAEAFGGPIWMDS